jgi:hypothetical protein
MVETQKTGAKDNTSRPSQLAATLAGLIEDEVVDADTVVEAEDTAALAEDSGAISADGKSTSEPNFERSLISFFRGDSNGSFINRRPYRESSFPTEELGPPLPRRRRNPRYE